MATRKTGGKKAAVGTSKKAAPRRGTRKASAKTAPEAAPAAAAASVPVAAAEPAASVLPPPSLTAPQGALVDVARTIGSTLGAIAATTRSALHKGKRGKKNA